MPKTYEKFTKDEMILRDELAVDRTMLSCERTTLSYIRTSLATLIGGVTIIKFFTGAQYRAVGWLFVVISIFIAAFGLYRYLRERKKFERFRNKK